MQGTKNLTKGPINRQLFNLAMPIMATSFIQMAYSLTDMAWVGRIGSEAVAAVGAVGILTWMSGSIALLNKVGSEVSVGQSIGARNEQDARQFASHNISIALLISICWAALLFLFANPILRIFELKEHITENAVTYLRIVSAGLPFVFLSAAFTGIYNAAGRSKTPFYISGTGLIMNIILDPLFIFGFGWGIKGSAWATVISQVISLTGQLIHFSRPTQLLHFKKGIFRLKNEIVKGILYIGLSPFLMNLCACLIVILINRGLKEHGGDMAIGAYGIVNRIIFLFIMIIMGFNQGMQPIAGYNFGARLYPRVTEVTKLTMKWAIGVATTGFLLCQLFPSMIVRMFTTDPELIAAAVSGLHIVFAVFPIVGFQMVATNFFLSIGMSKKAIFLSLTRQLLFLVPCLLILPPWLGTLGVWISIPIADATATAVTAVVLINQFRKFRAK